MVNNVETINQESTVKEQCHHHWVIESASGPTSRGVCRLCGTVKEFSNRIPDTRWHGDASLLFELADTQGIEKGGKEEKEVGEDAEAS